LELLYKTKRHLWMQLREVAREWQRERGELPADLLGPFKTNNNTLSVFALDDARNNSARILAAIGARSEKLVDTDCLVFDSEIVDGLGIARQQTPGQTPDVAANAWHFDLAQLTTSQLVGLAGSLLEHGQVDFFLATDLVSALKSAIAAGDVNLDEVSKKVRQQLG
jgi:hypothetical protein